MRTTTATATAMLLGLLGGCAHEQASGSGQPQTANEPAGEQAATVSQEENDAIDALFRRKAPQLQSCWADEYEKTHNRKLEGDITVGLMVTRSGKPDDVKVLKSSLGNRDVESCVIKEVATWGFPEVPVNTPYMRTVHLGAQF
jgi:TonB family protein